MSSPSIDIRFAREEDLPLVHQFIRDIAEYEKLSHEVKATEAELRDALFGPKPDAEVVLAFVEGQPAGFALFFHNFSTFVGRRGLYLEDLFVSPQFRGHGIGKALLMELVRIAADRRCGRMEWVALDWNQSAIEFYERLGARIMNEWKLFRLDESGIQKLAKPGRLRANPH